MCRTMRNLHVMVDHRSLPFRFFLGGFNFTSLCFYRKIRQMENDIISFLASGVVVQAPLSYCGWDFINAFHILVLY